MASPGQSTLFSGFGELLTTTYRAYNSKKPADQVSKHNALFRRLNEKGNMTTLDGGLSIVEPLDYQANSTYQRYSGYDTLNIGAVDVITAAEFPWRQAAVNIAVSGLELRTNTGANRIINLAKSKITNAQRSFANNLSTDLYSDGSAANQIGGLGLLVADSPSSAGTVGGIDQVAWPFWRNIVNSAAAPLNGIAAITPGVTTMEQLMLPLYLRLTRGGDYPDLIVASEDYFSYYEQGQTAIKRYTSSEEAQGGFVSMKYKLSDVFFDAAAAGMPLAHMYFLNTNFIKFVAHQDANMTIMPELQAVNQDAMVTPILFQGNVTCSARFLQGVIKA
jgi:hypothetical protein